ncbi:unnamed protein product [Allacma fusca]|uniref:Uncharacterized protein n=1 Tax=Allacma fusca TaxID=39272 RepID=A0A8J2K4K2_9HEXA|nr:unnamed protein product [Allacma fusca]
MQTKKKNQKWEKNGGKIKLRETAENTAHRVGGINSIGGFIWEDSHVNEEVFFHDRYHAYELSTDWVCTKRRRVTSSIYGFHQNGGEAFFFLEDRQPILTDADGDVGV